MIRYDYNRSLETENRNRKNKYKSKKGITNLGFYIFSTAKIIITIVLVIFLGSVLFPNWNITSFITNDKETIIDTIMEPSTITEKSNEEISKQEEIPKERDIDGISIKGLTKKEAKMKLLQSYNWKMSIAHNGQVVELNNILEDSIDSLLDDIYSNDKYGSYELNVLNIDKTLKDEVSAITSGWDIPAKNAQIVDYNKENNEFTYASEEYGIAINRDKLISDLSEAIKARDFGAIIKAEIVQTNPTITLELAKKQYKEISTYTTVTTDDSNRNNNIQLASNALNGLIIRPNEEFSFNKTTGNRTEERGYKSAGAYQNGLYIKEPGGGVCQVSSTLYNAVVFSGLDTTERYAHSFEPSYVPPGEDAMVSYDGYDGPDMKFINQSDTSIVILSTFEKQNLIISIYGIPILEEGISISMRSKKIKDLDPPLPIYNEVPTLQSGTEEIVKEAIDGSRWVTNLIVKNNDEIISDEFLHTSSYKGKAAIINRNSSESVLPNKNIEEEDKTIVNTNGDRDISEENFFDEEIIEEDITEEDISEEDIDE